MSRASDSGDISNVDEIELFRRNLIAAIDEKKYDLFSQQSDHSSSNSSSSSHLLTKYKQVLVKTGLAYNGSINGILNFIANTKTTDLYTPFLIQNVSEIDASSFKTWDIWELSKKWYIADPVFSLNRKDSSSSSSSIFILQHDREPGGMITVDISENYYRNERSKYNLSINRLGFLPRIENDMLFADFLLLSRVESVTMLYGTDFSPLERIINVSKLNRKYS